MFDYEENLLSALNLEQYKKEGYGPLAMMLLGDAKNLCSLIGDTPTSAAVSDAVAALSSKTAGRRKKAKTTSSKEDEANSMPLPWDNANPPAAKSTALSAMSAKTSDADGSPIFLAAGAVFMMAGAAAVALRRRPQLVYSPLPSVDA